MRWDYVDFKGRVPRIPAKITKGGRKLDLPLTSQLRDLLVARRALGDASPFIFPADSASGHLMECQFALNQVAKCCAVRVSPHDLRRTYATMAAPLISGFALKALLNHALGSADVTSGYVQFTAENLREPAQAVADKLMQLCGVEPVAGENVTTLR